MPLGIPINYASTSMGMRSRHRAVTHNWDLVITPCNQFAAAGLDTELTALTGGVIDKINCNCQSVTVPNTNVSTVEGNIRGVRFHQIQARSSAPIQTSLVFYEPHDYPLYNFFEKWKSKTVNRMTGAQDPHAWITEGVSIVLYTHDRLSKVIEYPLYDTYCQSASISDPSGAGNMQQVAVTLQSSNYGIKVYPVDGFEPAWVDVPVDLLGSVNGYRSADGKEYNADS